MLSVNDISLHLKNITLGKAWSWLGNCALANHSTAVHTWCAADFHGVINLIDFLEMAPGGGVKPALVTFSKFGLWFLVELSRLGAWMKFHGNGWQNHLSQRQAHSQLWGLGCGAGQGLQTAAQRPGTSRRAGLAAHPRWGLGFGSLQAHLLWKQMAELLWDRSCFVLGMTPASCKPTLVQEKYFTL